MRASYDEIHRTAFRALDAARSPAGIDEDSAHAVAWLEAAGLPGLTILADAIETGDPDSRARGLMSEPAGQSATRICADGLSCGYFAATVIDLLIAGAQTGEDGRLVIELADARHPLLLVPMAARFCPPQGRITVSWRQRGKDVIFAVTPASVLMSDSACGHEDWCDGSSIDSTKLECIADDTGSGDMPGMAGGDIAGRFATALRRGLDVDDEAFARVAVHAAKVMVPETAASRESGAGAGLTDND